MNRNFLAAATDVDAPVYWLLGLPFDAIAMPAVIGRMVTAAASRQPLIFATPNLNFLRTASRDQQFRDDVLKTDLCLVDGMPLVWIGKLLGIPFTERVAGSTLVESLLRREDLPTLKIFFFGGPEGAADAACLVVNRSARRLRAVGSLNPGFGAIDEMSSPDLIDAINSSESDLLCVSLGARKGHAWIERNRAAVRVPVIGHLGAVVNFLAGTVRRAPVWTQRCGLEWLWRIGQEPSLLSRYAYDAIFLLRECLTAVLPLSIWRALSPWRRRVPLACTVSSDQTNTVLLSGCLTGPELMSNDSISACFLPNNARAMTVNIDGLSDIDARGLGFLYELRYRRKPIVSIVGGSRTIRRLLHWHRASVLLERTKVS